jgi:hypothetical protein
LNLVILPVESGYMVVESGYMVVESGYMAVESGYMAVESGYFWNENSADRLRMHFSQTNNLPKIVATFVSASSQGQCTHSARTNYFRNGR